MPNGTGLGPEIFYGTTFLIREGKAPAQPRETLDIEWQSGSRTVPK